MIIKKHIVIDDEAKEHDNSVIKEKIESHSDSGRSVILLPNTNACATIENDDGDD